MTRGELQQQMSGHIVLRPPGNLLNRHTLSFTVNCIAFFNLKTHHVGLVCRVTGDITVHDGISGIIMPIGSSIISYDHRSYTLGIDIPLLIFPTLLQKQIHFREVLSLNICDTAKARCTDTLLAVGHLYFIIKLYGDRFLCKRYAGIQHFLRILGPLDRFVHLTQKHGAGSQHRDIHYSKNLHTLHTGVHTGTETIPSLFRENRGVYGYRRLHQALKQEGIILSEKVVRQIMKDENLVVFGAKQKKYSSYLGEITPEVENVLCRNFHADNPNEKWLTDITEFALPEGKLYLSPLIDCFDGLVVNWTVGRSPNAALVNTMLDQAIAVLPEEQRPIIHTDRGCHYRWPGWIERMERAGLTRSMSQKGCSPDNSACEGFFGRLKNEMFYGRSWVGISLDDFVRELDDYINWYNSKRIKLSLGGVSPLEYRHKLGLFA